jgi:hypothetical protein
MVAGFTYRPKQFDAAFDMRLEFIKELGKNMEMIMLSRFMGNHEAEINSIQLQLDFCSIYLTDEEISFIDENLLNARKKMVELTRLYDNRYELAAKRRMINVNHEISQNISCSCRTLFRAMGRNGLLLPIKQSEEAEEEETDIAKEMGL